MSITEGNIRPEADKTRRTIFIIAGLIAVVAVGFLIFYLLRRPEPQPSIAVAQNERLEDKFGGVLRAGSPEFESNRGLITLTQPDAEYASSVSGGMELTMATTVGNFTGRTIAGLEMKGTILDAADKIIKDRTVIVIPSDKVPELEKNQNARVPLKISGITNEQDRNNIDTGMAKLKVEVTAIKFK